MTDEYYYIDLIDSSTIFSIAFLEYSVVSVSCHGDVGWIPSSCSFLFFIIVTFSMWAHFYILYFVFPGFSFDAIELGTIYNKMSGYIRSSEDYCCG